MQVKGTIRRRLLVNYRVPLGELARRLPPGLEPKPVPGAPGEGMVGICLIRLERMRPPGLPAWVGMASENVAHRAAVRWRAADGAWRDGVYIPRRQSSSAATRLGGRLVGVRHDAASVHVEDEDGRVRIRVSAGRHEVEVSGRESIGLSAGSAFASLPEASEFFQTGATGCSPRARGRFAGVRLATAAWSVRPFRVEGASSTLLEETFGVPHGAPVDCALLMRDVSHRWATVPRRDLPTAPGQATLEVLPNQPLSR